MKIYRNCCGLDAHKQTIAACLIREDESARLRSSWDEVRYPALLANSSTGAASEAVCISGTWPTYHGLPRRPFLLTPKQKSSLPQP
jgi:hypothetical protein